jgi:uncharacterized RDD family membrane protein YckC
MSQRKKYVIASKSSRILAHILDRIIAFISFIVIVLISMFVFSIFSGQNSPFWLGALLGLIVTIIYALLADSLPNGQSLGKRTFGIAVMSTKRNKECNILESFTRNLFFAIPGGGVIEFLFVLINDEDDNDRRIGDILARTIVIRKDNKR